MELGSARDLKQQLLNDLIVPFARAAGPRAAQPGIVGASNAALMLAASTSLAVGARPLKQVPAVHRSVALGVARHGKQYWLAVRVQRQALMGSPLVEHLVREARGEADVRMIGRIDKRPARGRSADETSRKRSAPPRGRSGKQPATATPPAAESPWYQSNVRPLLIGASVGHVGVTAGTIGAFVERGGRVCILSNNHVLANENLASRGDRFCSGAALTEGATPGTALQRWDSSSASRGLEATSWTRRWPRSRKGSSTIRSCCAAW